MNDDEEPQTPARPASPSLVVLIGVVAGLTLAAAAAGALMGLLFASTPTAEVPGAGASQGHGLTKYGEGASLRELPPVITNLAEPSDAWVRVQASIVFDGKAVPKPEVLTAEIAQDMLGFLRTLSIAQIGGASGLQHLREDLNERATIRSRGLVRELIVQTVVVQ